MANTKNERSLKEKSKKISKSWKPYVIILAIIIIGGSIAAGIYSLRNHKNDNGNTTPPDTTIPITRIN